MIELKVEEYCQNCPDFAAKVSVKEEELVTVGDPQAIRICNTTVTCAHAKRCGGMVRYLDKVLKEVER